MKPYNERLPLIDKAIDKGYVTAPIGMVFLSMNKHGQRYWRSDKCSSGRYGCYKFICTRDEFNQRKAERQNKPSWSDAPEWANWLAQGVSGVWYWWSGKPIAKGGFWVSDVGDNDHPDPKMDSASSKGEVIGKWQDTIEKRPKQKEQDMNDWYEKGELPPVGSVITAIDKRKSSGGIKCELKYMGADVCVLYDIYDDCEFAVHPCHVEFLPLRTETDKLVEQMERSFESTGCVFTSDHRALAEHLIEQGYRKIKPMSEQEFMKQCLDICGHGDVRLFRAGCRFIEQVKV